MIDVQELTRKLGDLIDETIREELLIDGGDEQDFRVILQVLPAPGSGLLAGYYLTVPITAVPDICRAFADNIEGKGGLRFDNSVNSN